MNGAAILEVLDVPNASKYKFIRNGDILEKEFHEEVRWVLVHNSGYSHESIEELRVCKSDILEEYYDLCFTTQQYTKDYSGNRTKWIMRGFGKHVSKLFPIGKKYFRFDFQHRNDAGFILWEEHVLYMLIIPERKDDESLNDDILNGTIRIKF